jgi:hypothetical protein
MRAHAAKGITVLLTLMLTILAGGAAIRPL